MADEYVRREKNN